MKVISMSGVKMWDIMQHLDLCVVVHVRMSHIRSRTRSLDMGPGEFEKGSLRKYWGSGPVDQ